MNARCEIHLNKDLPVIGSVSVADSSLAFTASIGVLIQREPKDFHCLAVLNTQFSIQKVYCCS